MTEIAERINYSEPISLYDVIDEFIKRYLPFRRDYMKVQILTLPKKTGNITEVISFNNISNTLGNNVRVLDMKLSKASVGKCTDKDHMHLYIREIQGLISSCVTCEKGSFMADCGSFVHSVDLNKNISREYLNLFDKHREVLSLYNVLKADERINIEGKKPSVNKPMAALQRIVIDIDGSTIVINLEENAGINLSESCASDGRLLTKEEIISILSSNYITLSNVDNRGEKGSKTS